MPTPAAFDVTLWQPQMMLPVAADLRTMARTILDQGNPTYNAVVGLDRTTDWVGKSRGAADDRADAVKKWLFNISDNLSDVATSIEKGCENIANQMSYLDKLTAEADDAGYVLSDPMDASWPLQLKTGREEKSGDPDAMRSWSGRLVAQANDTFTAVNDFARSLAGELGQITTLTPPQLALNGTMGTRDAAMARDGWTPDEVRRVAQHLKDAQLTPEQIQALRNGGTANVPPGLVSYLRNLYNGLSPKDTLALRYALNGLGDGSGRALANGITSLSNERVAGGGTAGGFSELPKWMQDMMTERVPVDRPENYDGFARSFALGQLLSGATVPPGVRTGTELTLKTANLAAAARSRFGVDSYMADFALRSEWGVDNGLADPTGTDGRIASTARYHSIMEALLNTGLLNHESATTVLTGQGPGLPENYDRAATIEHLASHDWRDHGAVLGHLTDWIDDYALDQQDGYKSELSARAFRGLFDATTGQQQFNHLMNIGGADKPALGDINPLLAKALEEASRPYFNVLAGGNPYNYGFNPGAADHLIGLGDPKEGELARDFDLQDRVRRLFGLISSGDTNPPGLTGLTAREQLIQDIGYRQSVNAGMVPDALRQGNGFDADIAARNGWLQHLLRDGVMANSFDNWFDARPGDQRIDAQDFNSIKSNVNTIVKEGIKLLPIPGSSYVATGAGMLIDWAHAPTSTPPHEGIAPTRVGVDDTLLEQHWAAWMATHPQAIPGNKIDALLFYPDGSLKPLGVVVAENNSDTAKHPTISEPTLVQIIVKRLQAQGLDLTNYDATYNRYAGDDDDAISADEYDKELLGRK